MRCEETLIQIFFFFFCIFAGVLITPETVYIISALDSVKAPLQSKDGMACLPAMVNV